MVHLPTNFIMKINHPCIGEYTIHPMDGMSEGFPAWRIIPVSKWLVTPIYKSLRPFGSGIAPVRGLTNHGYSLLTKWDDPPRAPIVTTEKVLNAHTSTDAIPGATEISAAGTEGRSWGRSPWEGRQVALGSPVQSAKICWVTQFILGHIIGLIYYIQLHIISI